MLQAVHNFSKVLFLFFSFKLLHFSISLSYPVSCKVGWSFFTTVTSLLPAWKLFCPTDGRTIFRELPAKGFPTLFCAQKHTHSHPISTRSDFFLNRKICVSRNPHGYWVFKVFDGGALFGYVIFLKSHKIYTYSHPIKPGFLHLFGHIKKIIFSFHFLLRFLNLRTFLYHFHTTFPSKK